MPSDIGAASDGRVTIESILHEKKTYDLSISLEKLGTEDQDRAWQVEAPAKPTVVESLPNRSNLLSVSVVSLSLPSVPEAQQYIAVSTADRQLHLLNANVPSLDLVRSYTGFQDSPILDIIAIASRYLLIASMSGKLYLYDTATDKILDERRDHSKYLVKLATWSNGNSILVVSAGWDANVFVYQLNLDIENPQLGKPRATLSLPSVPETTCFVASPDDGKPILLVARRDSTFLHYYTIPGQESSVLTLLGKQNLALHSNAWIAFTPSDVQICPTDPLVVAVATSSTPHMKLLVVKLMLPPTGPIQLGNATRPAPDRPVTQASQARAELLIADKEEAAILVNVSTLAPQTAYSTPRLVWRPDGSGVYVSSDDGLVRGIETRSGRLITSLEGHVPGSKLRCLWAGRIQRDDPDTTSSASNNEYLISGGFDQKLILWSP